MHLANYSNFSPGEASWFSQCLTGSSYAADPHYALYYQGSLVTTNGIAAPDCRAPHGSQQLSGYFGNPTDGTFPLVGPVPASTVVQLEIGLPVRTPADGGPDLQTFIAQVSDPKMPQYRKYMDVPTFAATYGASVADYSALQSWATSNGLTILQTFPSNLLLSVSGTAAQIEHALYTNLIFRQRMDGASTSFVTTDREPSLDLTIPILAITGLDDYKVPAPAGCTQNPAPVTQGGSQPGGNYWGPDLRDAYLGGPTSACKGLTGKGQTVGILTATGPTISSGYIPSDISTYQFISAQLGGIVVPSGSGIVSVVYGNNNPNDAQGQIEETLDIESVLGMAPEANVRIFSTNVGVTQHADDALHAMANDGTLTSASNSWNFGRSANSQQAIDQMAAEGISYFVASGDFGAIDDPQDERDMDHEVLAGGTYLGTNPISTVSNVTSTTPPNVYPTPPNQYYSTERTWNGGCPGPSINDITGGGIMNGTQQTSINNTLFDNIAQCDCFPASFCCGSPVPQPLYQSQVPMVAVSAGGNGGSGQFRNYPDVSMAASNVAVFYQGAQRSSGGTSAAAPLWAGFTALVNEQAKDNNVGPLGFANPVLYEIGNTRGQGGSDLYVTSFNDINDGTFNSASPSVRGYPAVAGYDLATGWGSPTCGLITQLSSFDPLAKQTFDFIDFHIANGNDGVNDDSSVSLDVFGPDPNTLIQSFNLKSDGQSGWSDKGLVHDATLNLANPIPWNGIDHVVLHLFQNQGSGDRWDVAGLGIRLANFNATEECQYDLLGCDDNFVTFCTDHKEDSSGMLHGVVNDGFQAVVRLSETAGDDGVGGAAVFPINGWGCRPAAAPSGASSPFGSLRANGSQETCLSIASGDPIMTVSDGQPLILAGGVGCDGL